MMKREKFFFIQVVAVMAVMMLSTCQNDDDIVTIESISGYAQKGPFIIGSSVTVYDLNADLSPSGKTYNAQITDNKGTFEIDKISLSSDYIILRADGNYFNEVNGKQSSSQLTLYALSDISGKDEINVNVMTHLEKSRVEYLIKNGKTLTEAKTQAQQEILAIFNIETDDIRNSESLNISESGDDNGILLAISSLLQGYRPEGELIELMVNISNDLKEDGRLDSTSFGSALINHAFYLDTNTIKTNLVELYNLNETGISSFGKYITNFISLTTFPVTESLIEYPETGSYGNNILCLSKTEYAAGMDNWCSLAAKLSEDMSLKIRITSLSENYWLYSSESAINWSFTTFNSSTNSQSFTATEPGASCDLKIYFYAGTYLIEYFETGSETVTRTKTITVK